MTPFTALIIESLLQDFLRSICVSTWEQKPIIDPFCAPHLVSRAILGTHKVSILGLARSTNMAAFTANIASLRLYVKMVSCYIFL